MIRQDTRKALNTKEVDMDNLPDPPRGVEYPFTPSNTLTGQVAPAAWPDDFEPFDTPAFFGDDYEGPTWTRDNETNPPLAHYEPTEVLAWAAEQLERVRDVLTAYNANSGPGGGHE